MSVWRIAFPKISIPSFELKLTYEHLPNIKSPPYNKRVEASVDVPLLKV